jgi:soluble lytic murein transglycosylase
MHLTKQLVKLLFIPLLLLVLMTLLFIRTPHFARLYYPYRYQQEIEASAREYGVDPLLVAAIIRVESKFHPHAISKKGAMGLMQIMPTTAHWIASQAGMDNFNEKMLLEPEINIQLGTWYLASLDKQFDQRLDVVIAAYNGGRGQVGRWLEEGTWTGNFADSEQIPFPETRQFLSKVRKAYHNYSRLYTPSDIAEPQ